jgi:DNA polymerase elongation subunit (family B)
MQIEVVPITEQEILDTDDPIKSIRIRYNSADLVFEDDESKLLEDFSNYVISKDSDIIEFVNHDSNILNYLFERIRILSLDLQFGRRKTDIYSLDQNRIIEKWTQGRVYIIGDYGVNRLAGLIQYIYTDSQHQKTIILA